MWAFQIDMSMTIGDIIVTAGTITAIVIAYYGIKAALATLTTIVSSHTMRLDDHDDTLTLHGEGLAALDAAVFGRRRQDAHAKRTTRRIIEGTQ